MMEVESIPLIAAPVPEANVRTPSPKRTSPKRSVSPTGSANKSPRRGRSSKSPRLSLSRSPRRRRSGSLSPRRRSRSPRGRSRSPKKNGSGTPERYRQPSPCEVLGVFGLHPNTEKRDLEEEFGKHEGFDRVDLIIDRQTKKSKCFAFVYYKSDVDATKAREKSAGLVLHDRNIRIDFSVTKRAHSPTPGKYLGRATIRPVRHHYGDRHYSRSSYDYGSSRRSPPRYERRDYYDDRSYDRGYDRYDRNYERAASAAYDRYTAAFSERSLYDRGGYDRPSYDYSRRYR